MLIKKAQHPRPGIFYMVPDAKKPGKYILVSEEGSESLHLYLFDHVTKMLERSFKKISVSDAYTGVPRGRVIEPSLRQGDWIIAHGNDFALNEYRSDILSEFGLSDLDSMGKVRFEVDPHEKMGVREKELIEKDLGIVYTREGWKKKG